MARKGFSIELAVGIFILLGLIGVAYLTINLGGVDLFGSRYTHISARFNSVSGLKPGAQVEIAGVVVGKVDRIRLDDYRAVVDMLIEPGVEVQADAIASIKTQGIIGDKYVNISPGGSDTILKDGDCITETESAIDLEELVSKFVFGGV
jgi:phospholipid/cholesterol/gamma-HCH transport system substrate-binding protein